MRSTALAILTFILIFIQSDTTIFDGNGLFCLWRPKGVRVQGDCSYRVSGDLKEPQPLFLEYNKTEFLLPNSNGVVNLPNGKLFDLYCNKTFSEPFHQRVKITAQCLQGSFYIVDGLIRTMDNFSCDNWASTTARRTDRSCNGGTVLIEVGLEMVDGLFIKIMDVCHDEINEVNRYAYHKMNPSSLGYQRFVARPLFSTGEFYKQRNMNEVYLKSQQKATFDKILGQDSSKYFNASDICLTRGHLSTKTDHVYGSAQRATYFYVNTAPQWQTFNVGNWEEVENGVRKFVAQKNIEVDSYTGTWGVSTLPDVNGVEQELYMDFDENNNGLIPVPKLFFRVVVQPATKKGIVLIGVNSPHLSLEQIQNDYVICDDVSEVITWINWKKHDLMDGFMYACEVQQFRKVVTHLPEFDVKELLY